MLNRSVRVLLGLAVALALIVGQETKVLAATTGSISGTVTSADTHAPVAGAVVTAISPSGSFTTTTNAQGFFVIQGLLPDTYTLEVRMEGFNNSMTQGITIAQGGVAVNVNVAMSIKSKVLATVTVRGVSNYVQPTQTTDNYVVTTTASTQLLNDPFATNEAQLLTSLPGVSSANGYPIFRGGLENQAAIQIEGITVTDPFTNQFANNLIFNGVKSFSVTQGAGDATQGGAGTGGINSVVKSGSYPGFGTVQGELGFGSYSHNLNMEFGDATPDQRFSYYFSGRYDRQAGVPGIYHTKDTANLNDTLGDLAFTTTDDSVFNLHYKSRSQRDDTQLFYETGNQGFFGNYGINTAQLLMYSQDPNYQLLTPLFCGCNIGPNQLAVYPTVNPLLPHPPIPEQTQNYTLAKIGYSDRLSETAFLTARVYRSTGDTPFYITESNYPYLGSGFPGFNFGDFYEHEYYRQTGAAFDFQDQLNDKNALSTGAEYRQSTGAIVTADPSLSWLFEPQVINESFGPGGQFGPGSAIGGANGLRIPTFSQTSSDPVYFSNAYLTDVYKPNDKVTIQPGVRFDGQRVPTPAGLYNVHQVSPKMGVSYELSANTVVRASYGHATIFAPLGQIEAPYTPPAFYKNYAAPAGNGLCGQYPVFGVDCSTVYQELVSEWYANNGVAPYAFPKPQQSDSYDMSFEHDFGSGLSLKLTPYYRRDYDVIVSQAGLPLIISGQQFTGPQSLTNNAKGETFGVELGVSRQVAQGLSGQFNVTYINQFINYLSGGAFLPSVRNSTLATLVHPSYLPPLAATLALDEHKHGWHVNPTFIYSHGNPTGLPQSVYTLINGVYQAVPNTNLNAGSAGPCYYVDPQIPGSLSNPNVIGSYGGNCDKARDGSLTKANITMNLGVSHDLGSRATVGFAVYNVFNNTANGYNTNPGYINNGIGAYGPGSGFNQYAPGLFNAFGLAPILGAPGAYPPEPYFTTNSGPARWGTFYVSVKM